MYEAFFGLRNRPFSPLPRVDTFVPVAPLREPLTTLIRCVDQEQGIGVLTSPAGGGKSIICRMLFHHFREIRRTVLLTTARFPTRRALLQAILFELKHPYVGLSEQEARLRVLDLLQASQPPMNRMLLIVDEAHLLNPRGLEELRTLTDYEVDGTPSISLVLAGQLELEELLTEPGMNALNQRVGCHVCIEPLTFEESGQYIRERLRFAGNDGMTIFTPEATQLICSASEGNPRRLNQLCDHSLLIAFAEEKQPVDESVVRAALLDLRELPLHWNAPLDLTMGEDRNPLEEFVQKLDSDTIAFHDGPLADTDTELDLEDGANFDYVGEEESPQVESTVFEVGGHSDEHSIDQLFQVENFVVPNDFRDTSDLPDLPVEVTSSSAGETFAFEPPAAWEDPHSYIEPGSQHSEHSVSQELSATGFEPGIELGIGHSKPSSGGPTEATEHNTHAAYAERTGVARVMGFEELVVDDTYAVIDRLCEPQVTIPVARAATRTEVFSSLNHVKEAVSKTCPSVNCDINSKSVDNLDDALLDEPRTSDEHSITHDFGPSITPTQSAMLETQLLDFINEISLDVRQFREDLNTGHVPDTLAGTMEHTAQEVDRLLQLSKRRALQVQYDVVEPESFDEPVEETISATAAYEPASAHAVTTEAASLSSAVTHPEELPVSEQLAIREEKGRYAQLFTRLQRQRRSVETVMKQTQREIR